MKKLLLSLSLASVFITACATTRQYEESLKEWEGRPVSDLIKRWGSPSTTASLADGGKMYLYFRKNKENIKIKNETTDKVEPLFDCKTSFLTDKQDFIIGWKYDGHDCRK